MPLTIADIPDEVLANILSSSAVSDMVVSLWLCGNQALNARLKRGGCSCFVATIYELKKWPRVLEQLKSLRKVVVIAKSCQEPIEWMSDHVMNLSSGLEELHLDFPHAGLVFAKTLIWDVSYNPQPQPQLIDIGKLFPSLVHLSLDPQSQAHRSPYTHLLPRSLQTLHLGSFFLNTLAAYEALPSSLTSLNVHSNFATELTFPVLPKSLTHANEVFLSAVTPMCRDMALKCVQVDVPSLKLNGLLALPHSLTRLYLSSEMHYPYNEDGKAWTSFLPASLTSLLFARRMRVSDIAELPPSITKLETPSIAGLRDQLQLQESLHDFWPKKLVSLSIYSPVDYFEPIFHSILPRTLTHLRLPPTDFTTANCGNTLPPDLTELEFDSFASTPKSIKLSPKLLKFSVQRAWPSDSSGWLPRNLTSLELSKSPLEQPPSSINLALFPLNLTHLSLACIWASDLGKLPRTLLSFDLIRLYGTIDISCFKHLPSSLNRLNIDELGTSMTIYYEAFGNIPSSLKELDLRKLRLSLELLVYLPTTVAVLKLKSIMQISTPFAKRLPVRWLSYLLNRFTTFDYDKLPIIHECWPTSLPRTPIHQAQLDFAKLSYK